MSDKLSLLKTFLKTHVSDGELPADDILLDFLKTISARKSKPKYTKGAFVCFYYGMGEMGHGEIVSSVSNGYRVQVYFGGVPGTYIKVVTKSDMRGVCTIADELEYEKERSTPPVKNNFSSRL